MGSVEARRRCVASIVASRSRNVGAAGLSMHANSTSVRRSDGTLVGEQRSASTPSWLRRFGDVVHRFVAGASRAAERSRAQSRAHDDDPSAT